jgi:L-fuculose-phosphate aldolase
VDEDALRQTIVEIGRWLWGKGFIAASDGNISARVDDDTILITPSGVRKGLMSAAQMVKVRLNGEVVEGDLEPSSEMAVHLVIYAERPDIGAIVHAHPPNATGFAVVGIAMEEPFLPEVVARLRGVPLVPFAEPGSWALANLLRPFVRRYDAVLLQNHGVVASGRNLEDAYGKLETVELAAQTLIAAHLLGSPRSLPQEFLQKHCL